MDWSFNKKADPAKYILLQVSYNIHFGKIPSIRSSKKYVWGMEGKVSNLQNFMPTPQTTPTIQPPIETKISDPHNKYFFKNFNAPLPSRWRRSACHVKKNDNFCQNRFFTTFSKVLEFLPVFSFHAILIQIGYQLNHRRYT